MNRTNLQKQIVYFRLTHGGIRGRKEGVPPKLARLLTKEKLPQYDAKEAALVRRPKQRRSVVTLSRRFASYHRKICARHRRPWRDL
eukprot:SAG11_NODE_8598_length_997_cov_0.918708_1_plen_86_part_00